jgi:hypothetical protein
MPRPTKARKVDEAQRQELMHYLHGIPPADAAIMTAGAFAGTQGYTPMTMLLKGLSGDSTSFNIVDKIMQGTPLGFNLRAGEMIADIILGKSSQNAAALTQHPSYDAIMRSLALGSIGMVEAYTISRPGALAATLNMIQTGIGQVAGAVGKGAALL